MAQQNFVARFQKGQMPTDIAEVAIEVDEDMMALPNVLKNAGLVSSTSEAMRMIKQGAVKIDGERVEDKDIALDRNHSAILQVGKRRFARVNFVAKQK